MLFFLEMIGIEILGFSLQRDGGIDCEWFFVILSEGFLRYLAPISPFKSARKRGAFCIVIFLMLSFVCFLCSLFVYL